MNKEENMEETDDKSFAELFEQSFKKPTRLEPGQKVEAVIVKITDEWVFLDLGDKSEGCLDKNELLDTDGKLTAAEGDRVSAYFLSAENNYKLFTTRVSGGAAGNQYLEDAFHSRIPVEGVAEGRLRPYIDSRCRHVPSSGTPRPFQRQASAFPAQHMPFEA